MAQRRLNKIDHAWFIPGLHSFPERCVASAPSGHSRPTPGYKTFPAISLRYTPGARPRADTRARGGHTRHLADEARGNAHSGCPRQQGAGLPPAPELRHTPAATIRESAKTAETVESQDGRAAPQAERFHR